MAKHTNKFMQIRTINIPKSQNELIKILVKEGHFPSASEFYRVAAADKLITFFKLRDNIANYNTLPEETRDDIKYEMDKNRHEFITVENRTYRILGPSHEVKLRG
jgi:Arc/MetJ-type ribon-helix-helix transcriptional regulator